jgi:rhodanese-related sulfurtransferase
MDQTVPTILPADLSPLLGSAPAPVLVDLRSAEQISAAGRLIPGAIRRSPADVQTWWPELPRAHPVVVFDLSGGEKCRLTVETLRQHGLQASRLEGGFAVWRERKFPTRRVIATNEDKWVTRERPKIDRIACPWLIRRFINPSAQFIYVPKSRVLAVAAETGATPYDIDGVEFTHVGERCSFDAILLIFDLDIPPLNHLATIVRGADTSRHDLAEQCGGLVAISLGLSTNFADDHQMLEHGMIIYDALYSWCRSREAETHDRPPAAGGGAT